MGIGKKWIILFVITISCNLFAQNLSPKDSLLEELKNSPEDTSRYSILANLVFTTYMENPQEALDYSNQMIVLSEKIGFKSGVAVGNSYAGYFEEMLGNPKKALKNYFVAIPIFQELDSLTDEAILYNNVALVYTDLGDIDLAVKYNFRSLAIKLELGDTERIATTIYNIGILYQRQDDVKKALECYVKAINLYKAINIEAGVANCIRQIGLIFSAQGQFKEAIAFYSWALVVAKKKNDLTVMENIYNLLGDSYQQQGEYKTALNFYYRGKNIAEALGTKTQIGEALMDIGHIYFKQNKYEIAMNWYGRGLAIMEKSDNMESICFANQLMAELYYKTKKFDLALKHVEVAYQLANELGYPNRIKNAAAILFKLYKMKGSFEKSLLVYETYITTKDSMERDEGRKLVNKQKLKFETDFEEFVEQQRAKDEMEKKIAQITRRNILQYMGIFVFILIAFGFTLSLEFMKVSPLVARVFIFVSLLILFEFLLVLSDPYTDRITNGIPIYKLLVNTLLATFIFPIHSFIERKLKKKFN